MYFYRRKLILASSFLAFFIYSTEHFIYLGSCVQNISDNYGRSIALLHGDLIASDYSGCCDYRNLFVEKIYYILSRSWETLLRRVRSLLPQGIEIMCVRSVWARSCVYARVCLCAVMTSSDPLQPYARNTLPLRLCVFGNVSGIAFT